MRDRDAARFARSLDELMARIETYRAIQNIRDMRAGGLLEREGESCKSSDLSPCRNNNKITCNLLLQNVKIVFESGQDRLEWTLERVV